jgi:SOUL heme-binding protein
MIQSFLNFLWSVVFFVTSTFGISMSTEQQRYDVIEKIGKDIEIRQYPKRIVAETTVDANNSANRRGDAFNIVAAYIFGANKARQKIYMTTPVEIAKPSVKIPMTAPVEINTANDAVVMRFFMPSRYSRNDLPDPSDPRVKLVELEPMTAAVLVFSGSTSDKAVSMRTTELRHFRIQSGERQDRQLHFSIIRPGHCHFFGETRWLFLS